MTSDVILAIDNGTQSVRALAFNGQGALLAKSQVKLSAYTHPQSGWMEHDVEEFWRSVCTACQGLWNEGIVRAEQVKGLVITTQRATVVNLDKEGRPLRPAIVWPDTRRAAPTKNVPLKWRAIFRVMGLQATINAVAREAEANWIAQNQPDIWRDTHKFLLLSGYLNYRFTDRFVDAVPNQVGYIPFDFKTQDWCAPGDWKWPVMGVPAKMLPDLAQACEVIGEVTGAASTDTGIPVGTPVIAGASDKACEVLGCGAIKPNIGAISCGTTATINVTTPRYVETSPSTPPYPAAIPHHYNVEVQVSNGFRMVSWFGEEFGLWERQLAEKEGGVPEMYFDRLIDGTSPGADGLMIQPYWNAGVHEPGPEARGTIVGFTEQHTRAHVYRSIIEGLAYALREGGEKIEARGKVKMKRLCVAGGGSQSDAVMQIIADVLNLPAERPSIFEASGLGAAMIGSVGLGWAVSPEAAVGNMAQQGQVFEPNRESAKLYDHLYKDIYTKLYDRIAPIYKVSFDRSQN